MTEQDEDAMKGIRKWRGSLLPIDQQKLDWLLSRLEKAEGKLEKARKALDIISRTETPNPEELQVVAMQILKEISE